MKVHPTIHNQRSPQQWEIIRRHVPIQGKRIIDLGCGYADILIQAGLSGASEVVGVEDNVDILYENLIRFKKAGLTPRFKSTSLEDIKWRGNYGTDYDIAICFSVLPYIEAYKDVLEWMLENATQSLIEVQYVGDGPGTAWKPKIKYDDEMRFLLEAYWASAVPIGSTHVQGRGVDRVIWLCQ